MSSERELREALKEYATWSCRICKGRGWLSEGDGCFSKCRTCGGSGRRNAHVKEIASIPEPALSLPAAPSAWQPIETAPKDGSLILVGYPGKNGYCKPSMWDQEWLSMAGNRLTPTHWQPLPAPPAKDEVGG